MAKEILGELPAAEARNPAYADHDGLEVFDADRPLHRQVRVGGRRGPAPMAPSCAPDAHAPKCIPLPSFSRCVLWADLDHPHRPHHLSPPHPVVKVRVMGEPAWRGPRPLTPSAPSAQFGVSASAAGLWPGQRRDKVYATYDGPAGGGAEDRPSALALSEKLGITLPTSLEYGDAEGGGGSPMPQGSKVRCLDGTGGTNIQAPQPPPSTHTIALPPPSLLLLYLSPTPLPPLAVRRDRCRRRPRTV